MCDSLNWSQLVNCQPSTKFVNMLFLIFRETGIEETVFEHHQRKRKRKFDILVPVKRMYLEYRKPEHKISNSSSVKAPCQIG